MNNQNKTSNFPPIAFVLSAVLLWSFGGLFIKFTALDAFAVNAGRSFFAAVTVAVFTYKKGLRLDRFTILTSLTYAGTLSCFVYANKTTTAANAIFLQYTAPVYILIFAPFILKEKFRATDLITVVICLAGMSLFFLEPQNAANELASNIYSGNIAALASGVFFGFYFILLRHPRSLANENPALSVFYGNIIIVLFIIVLLMLLFLFDFVFTGEPLFFGVSFTPEINAKDVCAILFLGIFQIGVAYILFTNGIAKGVRSLDASVVGFVEPLLNPVWVFFFLGEKPSQWAMLGGAIILAAVVFHTIKSSGDKSIPGEPNAANA